MRNILAEIIEYKREFVKDSKKKIPLCELEQLASEMVQTKDFRGALAEHTCALIAEIKTASPSKGIIRDDLDVIDVAKIYEKNGASCISVLTDEKFFKGNITRLSEIRKISGLPLLRKDFIIDVYQVFEARAFGADAVLLIASCLDNSEIIDLMEVSALLGLDYLVEVHDEAEMRRISGLNINLIGINNRNLKTFETDILTTGKLSSIAPEGSLIVSESGIFTTKDVKEVYNMGAGAVLVGEAIIKEKNIAAKVLELSNAVI